MCLSISTVSTQNFGRSVPELASGELIQSLYLRGGKTERKVIALIMHLIRLVKTSGVLFRILHLLLAHGGRWLFLWKPEAKRQKTITFINDTSLKPLRLMSVYTCQRLQVSVLCSSSPVGWADLATLSFNKFGTQNGCERPWGWWHIVKAV